MNSKIIGLGCICLMLFTGVYAVKSVMEYLAYTNAVINVIDLPVDEQSISVNYNDLVFSDSYPGTYKCANITVISHLSQASYILLETPNPVAGLNFTIPGSSPNLPAYGNVTFTVRCDIDNDINLGSYNVELVFIAPTN